MSENEPKKPPVVLETPCKECPWRLANQGKRHPDGWYTTTNLRRLWAKLRQGEQMSCHRTDPGNEVSERARAAGAKSVPEDRTPSECAGAIILVQRELMYAQDAVIEGDKKRYAREHKLGLTKRGIMLVIERAIFEPLRGALGGQATGRLDLNQEGVGAPWLKPWVPRNQKNEEEKAHGSR